MPKKKLITNNITVQKADGPFFTIITPLYNQEERVIRCVESVIKQSYGNFEYIIIDDGSTDNSYEVAKGFSQQDNRIRLFHQDNHGSNYSYNRGLSLSVGKYIVMLDNDDWLEQDTLSSIYEKIVSFNYPDVVQMGVRWIWENDGKTSEESRDLIYIDSLRKLRKQLFGTFVNTNTRKVIKKELYEGVKYNGNPTGADSIVNTKIFNRAVDFLFVPGIHYNVTILGESQSHSVVRDNAWRDNIFAAYQECISWLQNNVKRSKYLLIDTIFELYRLKLINGNVDKNLRGGY